MARYSQSFSDNFNDPPSGVDHRNTVRSIQQFSMRSPSINTDSCNWVMSGTVVPKVAGGSVYLEGDPEYYNTSPIIFEPRAYDSPGITGYPLFDFESYVIPISGYYPFSVTGMNGYATINAPAGRGASVRGEFYATAGDIMRVATSANFQIANSIWNDAGISGNGVTNYETGGIFHYNGGNSSFIFNQTAGQLIAIAGGGGSAGRGTPASPDYSPYGGSGGNAGLLGGSGSSGGAAGSAGGGGGATQSSGGSAGVNSAGSAANGSAGRFVLPFETFVFQHGYGFGGVGGGGGGGGGYYTGGGGAGGLSGGPAGGGGGGSSWINPTYVSDATSYLSSSDNSYSYQESIIWEPDYTYIGSSVSLYPEIYPLPYPVLDKVIYKRCSLSYTMRLV